MDRVGTATERGTRRGHHAVVLIGEVDRRIVPALRFTARLADVDVRALHVSVDRGATRRLAREWMELDLTWLPLHIREGSAETFLGSVRRAVEDEAEAAGDLTVILPEARHEQWWSVLLHRRSARRIARVLAAHPRVTTVIVPYFVVGRGADVGLPTAKGRACAQDGRHPSGQ